MGDGGWFEVMGNPVGKGIAVDKAALAMIWLDLLGCQAPSEPGLNLVGGIRNCGVCGVEGGNG